MTYHYENVHIFKKSHRGIRSWFYILCLCKFNLRLSTFFPRKLQKFRKIVLNRIHNLLHIKIFFMLSATWLPPAIFKCVLSFQHIINWQATTNEQYHFSICRWTKLWHLSKYHIHLPLLHLLYTTNYSHLQCKMQWIHCIISNCRNLTWNCIGYLYYSFVHILSKKAAKTEIKRGLKRMIFIWM